MKTLLMILLIFSTSVTNAQRRMNTSQSTACSNEIKLVTCPANYRLFPDYYRGSKTDMCKNVNTNDLKKPECASSGCHSVYQAVFDKDRCVNP